ncbi:unnamed protein product [Cercospora beticola]|nr:unnamed protein product [Cercospora beticola]
MKFSSSIMGALLFACTYAAPATPARDSKQPTIGSKSNSGAGNVCTSQYNRNCN